MITIGRAKSSQQVAAVQALMREYLLSYLAQTPGSENAAAFQGWETEIESLPGIYAPPKGRLLLATFDDQPAGCVALKSVQEDIAELKRLFMHPAFRGHGIGEQMVNVLIEEARSIGYRRVILDSHISMKAAHKIYLKAGFKFVDSPPDLPQEFKAIVVFMECELQ